MISQGDLGNLIGITWLDHSDPKFYDLVLIGGIPDSHQILLHVHLGNQLMDVLTEIPVDTEFIIWSPDGSGGLVIGRHNQILFAPVQGGVIDLSPVLGSDAHDFLWLPPAPRS